MKKIWMFFLALLTLLPEGMASDVQTIALNLNDVTVNTGEWVDVPIIAESSMTGKEISSFSLQLEYNPSAMELDTVVTSGTLTESFGPATYNERQPNSYQRYVTIAGSGSAPLEGSGVFITLRFKALKYTGWHELKLTGAGKNYFNEGYPTLASPTEWCYIKVVSPPVLSINPTQSTLVKGETLQFQSWSDAAPFTWSVTDTLVASIDANGLLTAVGLGTTQVKAIDTLGVSGLSGAIQVVPFRLSIPRDLTQHVGQLVEIPILVTNLTDLNVLSGQFRLKYYAPYLQFEGIDAAGTLLEQATVSANATEDGRLRVAFAGTSPIGGQGVLLKAKFRLIRSDYGSDIEVEDCLFNETLRGTHANGWVSTETSTSLSLYPHSGNLVVGESKPIDINGAIEPIQWSVSDDKVASIDQTGLVKALRRGSFSVTAVDSAGASVSTEMFTVFDTRVSIADSSICTYSEVIYYPVTLEQLPLHDVINAFEASIHIDTTLVEFLGISKEGSLTQDWSAQYNLPYVYGETLVDVAFSSAQALVSSGVLFYLKLKPKPGFNMHSNSYIQIKDFLFNEQTPTALLSAGAYIKGQVPYEGQASIYDIKGWNRNYCLGDTISIRADAYNVRYPMYQWFINGIEVPGAVQPVWKATLLLPTDTVQCLVTALDPCIVDPILWSDKLTFNINMPPLKPDSIQGDTVLLIGSKYNYYSVPAQNNVYQYHWNFPSGYGGDIDDDQAVSVNVTDSAQAGWVSVYGINDCGVGDTAYLYIVPMRLPEKPDTLYVPSEVCLNDSVQFSVKPVINATGYLWTLPYGMHGSSDSSRIWVSVSDSACGGWVTVQAINGPFEGDGINSYVSINSPPTYAWVEGPTEVTLGAQGVQYTAGSSGGETYTWLLPAGMTGNSSTSRIDLDVSDTFTGGIVAVVPSNACGAGDTAWVSVSVSTNPYEYELNGPVAVCKGTDSVLYVMDNYPGTVTYQWQLPTGMTGQSSTDSIWVNVSETAQSGEVKVWAQSPQDTLAWSQFVQVYDSRPVKVDTIYGPTSIASTETLASYRASSQSAALSYAWIFPEGFDGVSYGENATIYLTDSAKSGRIGVVPINPCGRGDTTYLNITVVPVRSDSILGDTAICRFSYKYYRVVEPNDTATYYWELPLGFSIDGSSTGYDITVYASDVAVSGPIRAYITTGSDTIFVGETHVRLLTSGLLAPGMIQGPGNVAKGDQEVTYRVDPVPDAYYYQWALPMGLNGMSTSNSIQVNVGMWAQSGYVYVRASNDCYTSDWTSLYIQVDERPIFTDSIYGSDWLCAGSDSVMYEVTEMDGMTGYSWTLSPNLTGTSTTHQIWVNVADTATLITLSVKGYNETDTGKVIVRSIRVNPRPIPMGIQGPITVSPGELPIEYTVKKLDGIFHYFWELPEGFDGLSWSDTIQVIVTDTAKSGWIRVMYGGPCSHELMDSLYVTVDTTFVGLKVVKTSSSTYPNPFRETLNLRSPLLLDGQAVVSVLDLNGVRLPIEAVGKGEERTLNFGQQPAGFYLIVVQTPSKTERVKVLKQ